MASPPVSTSASSIYDVTLDAPTSSPPGVDLLGLGKPYMPCPRDVARNGLHPMRYAFAQAFGEQGTDSSPIGSHHEADMISAVSFNHRCDMIATGDRGGRIVILKRVNPSAAGKRRRNGRRTFVRIGDRADMYGAAQYADERDGDDDDPDSADHDDDHDAATDDELVSVNVEPPEFRFWTQFQSHEPEFDYLKSMEIEEKINQICWCRGISGAQRMIATNDKTIKMWRVFEKEVKTIATMDPASLLHPRTRTSAASSARPSSSAVTRSAIPSHRGRRLSAVGTNMGVRRDGVDPASAKHYSRDAYQLSIPRLELRGRIIAASSRREYSSAHAYHINSISLNTDEETFLSADDLRVNLWNLNRGGRGFNILDLKPGNMEDLTEVITSAEFHPKHCHLFMHSSSRGSVKLCDLRMSALCESWARQFEEPENTSGRMSFFSEIVASISDINFSPDGRYILTRDYMSLRLWDVNMERAPVLVVPVHEYLRSRLCDLYENDCIFDKFKCRFSSDGGSLLTGSYNSLFQSYSAYDGSGAAVEASVDFVSGLSGRHRFTPEGLTTSLIAGSSAAELVDPSRRIMYLDSAPCEQIAAAAAGPALYLYYGLPQ